MRFVRLAHLRSLKAGRWRTVLAILAVAAGTSLATAVLIEVNSVSASVSGIAAEVAAPAPIRVTGHAMRGGLDAAVVDRIAATEGVDVAVPVIQAVAMARQASGTERPILAFGVDCRVESLVGPVGCSQEAVDRADPADAPIVSPSLQAWLADGGVIRNDLGRGEIDQAPVAPDLDQINDGRVAVYALPAAQDLFARVGRVDIVYVVPEEGADLGALRDRLKDELGPTMIVASRDEPPIGAMVNGPILPLLGLISLFAVAIGGMIVFNVVELSLEQRRKTFALYLALGTSTRTVRRGAVAEGAILGALGGVLGVLIGIVVAGGLVSSLSADLERVSGIGVSVHVGVLSILVGMLLAILVGALAAYLAARRISAVDPAGELRGNDYGPATAGALRTRRAIVLGALAAFGLILSQVARSQAAVDPMYSLLSQIALVIVVLTTIAGAAALAPILLRAFVHRGRSAVTRLAAASLVQRPGRASGLAGAVAAAAAVGFVLANLVPVAKSAVGDSLGSVAGDRLWVSTLGVNNTANIDAKVPTAIQEELRAYPGVERIDRSYQVGAVLDEGISYAVVGQEGQLFVHDVAKGAAAAESYAAGKAIVGTGLARFLGLGVGDQLELDTTAGTLSLEIGTIWTDPTLNGNNVTLAPDEIEKWFGPQPPVELYVTPAAGVDPLELARSIEGDSLYPGLDVKTPDEFTDALAADIGKQIRPFWLLQIVLVGVAVVAAVALVVLVAVHQRRELAVLSAVGMDPRDLVSMFVVATGGAAAAGALLGLVAGVAILESLRLAAPALVGLEPPFRIVWSSVVTAPLVPAVLVAAAGILPALRARRIDPASALKVE